MDYHKHYDLLIERARNRVLEGYGEWHHILPRCMGGGDEPDNLVHLTPEEHYIAHQLLVKMHPGNNSLIYAVIMMGGTRKNNKVYGWVRRKFSEAQRGLPTSEETKAKMSAAHMGKPKHNAESRKKIAAARSGVPWTEAQRAARPPPIKYTVDGKTWDSIKECAEHYGVSVQVIYGWRAKGYTKSQPKQDFSVTYEGVVYPSVPAAAKAHGISRQAMTKRLERIKSGKKPGARPWNAGTSAQVRNTKKKASKSAK